MTIARAALLLAIAGAAFVADASSAVLLKSPYADLGVLDGVIRSVDRDGMFVEVHYRTGGIALQRIDFGPHMLLGAAGIATTRGDLAPGRAIGMVIRRQPVGPMRAVRVWLD